MNIYRSEFLKACFTLLGEEYGRKLLDAKYNPADFCELISSKYFIDDLSSNDFKSLQIVKEVANRLHHEGSHGLLEG